MNSFGGFVSTSTPAYASSSFGQTGFFSSTPTSTSTGAFGSSPGFTSPTTSTSSGLFGSNTSTSTLFSSSFGSTGGLSSGFGAGGSFGHPGFSTTSVGTGNPPYQATKDKDELYHNICCMTDYQNKSLDELRYEDWKKNKGGTGSAYGSSLSFGQPSGSTFGSNIPSSTGFGFGSGSSGLSFGSSTGTSGFGSTPSQSTSGFGFGSSGFSFGSSTGTTFGSSTGFGSTGSGFGSSTGTTFGSSTGFGSTGSGLSFGTTLGGSTGFGTGSTSGSGFGFSTGFGSPTSSSNTGFSFSSGFGSSTPSSSGLSFGSTPSFGTSGGFGSSGGFGTTGTTFSFSPSGFGSTTPLSFSSASSLGSTSYGSATSGSGFSFGAPSLSSAPFTSTIGSTPSFSTGSNLSGGYSFGSSPSSTGLGSFSFGGSPSSTSTFSFAPTSSSQFNFGNSFGNASPSFGSIGQSFSSFGGPVPFQSQPQQLEASLTKDPFGILPSVVKATPVPISPAPITPVGPTQRSSISKVTVTPHYKVTPKTVTKVQPRSPTTLPGDSKSLEIGRDLFVTRKNIKKLEIDTAEAELSSPLFDKSKKAEILTPYKQKPDTELRKETSSSYDKSDEEFPISNSILDELPSSPAGLTKRVIPTSLTRAVTDLSLNESSTTDMNYSLPKLTRRGYFTKPTMDELERMTHEELRHVKDFTVGLTDVGQVKFLGETDVTGVDLDNIILFEDRSVEVYPDETIKPPVGQGLNKPSEISLYRCWPKDKATRKHKKDTHSITDFEAKLHQRCHNFPGNSKFISYSPHDGTWVFQVDHFTKYGVDDDDDDDEDDDDEDEDDQSSYLSPINKTTTRPPMVPTAISKNKEMDPRIYKDDKYLPSKVYKSNMDKGYRGMARKDILQYEHGKDRRSPEPDDFSLDVSHDSSSSDDYRKSRTTEDRKLSVPPDSTGSSSSDEQHSYESEEDESMDFDDEDYSSNSEESEEIYGGPPRQLAEQLGLDLPKMHDIRVYGSLFRPPKIKSVEGSPFSPSRYYTEVSPPPTYKPMKVTSPPREQYIVSPTPPPPILPKKEIVVPSLENSKIEPWLCMQMRSFRVGWAPDGRYVNASTNGTLTINELNIQPNIKEQHEELLSYHLSKAHKIKGSPLPFYAITSFNDIVNGYIAILEKNNDISLKNIWELVKALFSKEEKENEKYAFIKRKIEFNKWLQWLIQYEDMNTQYHDVDDDVAIFQCLTRKRIKEAVDIAMKCKEYRFAILLAQSISCNQSYQRAIYKQLELWDKDGKNLSIYRNKIYLLLAGIIHNSDMISLDWKRALGFHLWYHGECDKTLEDAVLCYENSYKSGKVQPPYSVSTNEYYDIRYHLLCYYCHMSPGSSLSANKKNLSTFMYHLSNELHPLTWSMNSLNYSLCWHLISVFEEIGKTREEDYNIITSSYAHELELMGLWEWAIYIYLNLPDLTYTPHSVREHAIRTLLDRHAPMLFQHPEKVEFLVNILNVPQEMVDTAKATYAHYMGDYRGEVEALVHSHQWEKAHDVLVDFLAPKLLLDMFRKTEVRGYGIPSMLHLEEMDSSYTYLVKIIEDIRKNLVTWNLHGDFYLEYLNIIPKFHNYEAKYEMDILLSKLQPLAEDIENMCDNNGWRELSNLLVDASTGKTFLHTDFKHLLFDPNGNNILKQLLHYLQSHESSIPEEIWNRGPAKYIKYLDIIKKDRHHLGDSDRLQKLKNEIKQVFSNISKINAVKCLPTYISQNSISVKLYRVCVAAISNNLFNFLSKIDVMLCYYRRLKPDEKTITKQVKVLKKIPLPDHQRLVALQDMTMNYLQFCVERNKN